MSLFDSLILSNNSELFQLKSEQERGYIEYKLRLDLKDNIGLKKLVSQMSWRLDEGKRILNKRETHYIIGIRDNGIIGKLTETELNSSQTILENVVKECKASVSIIEKKYWMEYCVIYYVIQKMDSEKIYEINIAFVGPSQNGKTTTISHLVYGICDDGDGNARKITLKHKHEKETGISTCLNKEFIGMKNGTIVNYNTGLFSSGEEIVDMSDKIINLIDLVGEYEYIKSTLTGLLTYRIDMIFIVINYLKINEENIKKYKEIINFYNMYSKLVETMCAIIFINENNKIHFNDIFPDIKCYIIEINNITEDGIDVLISFIDTIPQKKCSNLECYELFYVLEKYNIPETGVIYSGIINTGNLSVGQQVNLIIGTTYFKTKIKSIHKKQIESCCIYAGETGTILLEKNIRTTEKNVIISTSEIMSYNQVYFHMVGMILNSYFTQNISEIYDKLISETSILYIRNQNVSCLCKEYNEDTIIIQLHKQIIIPLPQYVFLKNSNGICFGVCFEI